MLGGKRLKFMGLDLEETKTGRQPKLVKRKKGTYKSEFHTG